MSTTTHVSRVSDVPGRPADQRIGAVTAAEAAIVPLNWDFAARSGMALKPFTVPQDRQELK
jgi:hypothetical protein